MGPARYADANALQEALREVPSSRQRPRKSTSALDDASSISRKARVGQKIVSVALKQFCKSNAPHTTRVLVRDPTYYFISLLEAHISTDGFAHGGASEGLQTHCTHSSI